MLVNIIYSKCITQYGDKDVKLIKVQLKKIFHEYI